MATDRPTLDLMTRMTKALERIADALERQEQAAASVPAATSKPPPDTGEYLGEYNAVSNLWSNPRCENPNCKPTIGFWCRECERLLDRWRAKHDKVRSQA